MVLADGAASVVHWGFIDFQACGAQCFDKKFQKITTFDTLFDHFFVIF